MINKLKIAIVHDELLRRGGAERVVLYFHKAFPDAPIYTTAYRENDTYLEFKECKIITSWYDKIIKNEFDFKKFFFPLGILAMKMLDLREYDIVLQSGTHCSKYVKVRKDALVFSYCYTPFRLAWEPTSYAEYLEAKGFRKIFFNIIVQVLKIIDKYEGKRPDFFIAMTEETKNRLRIAYNPRNNIEIIRPPVDSDKFYVSNKIGDYYLLVSRLEYYKKVDLVIKAFNKLGKKLIIVGKGSKETELKKIAGNNIEFKSGLSTSELVGLYSSCKGFLMPQHEDYGITPLEANASGRPVIAYAKGGVLETMIPYDEDSKLATCVFFQHQTVESLVDAVNIFENLEFDPLFIRSHSEKFDQKIFIEQIKNYTLSKLDTTN